jgi:hypothetical protein
MSDEQASGPTGPTALDLDAIEGRLRRVNEGTFSAPSFIENSVPALIREVRRLRTELQRAQHPEPTIMDDVYPQEWDDDIGEGR